MALEKHQSSSTLIVEPGVSGGNVKELDVMSKNMVGTVAFDARLVNEAYKSLNIHGGNKLLMLAGVASGVTLQEKRQGAKSKVKVATYIAGDAYLKDSTKPVLLWSHGNAEFLAHFGDERKGKSRFVQFMDDLSRQLRVAIVCYDYPGWGASEGISNEGTIRSAMTVIMKHLEQVHAVPSHNVISVGYSIGSGPAMSITHAFNLRGLMLFSAYTSIMDVAPAGLGLSKTIGLDMFCNSKDIKLVDVPIAIVHGSLDTVIPVEHSKQLKRVALKRRNVPAPLFVILHGFDHQDYWTRQESQITKTFEDFFLITEQK